MKVIFPVILIGIVFTACTTSINETVYVRDGETKDSGINTVNGNIIIGNNCQVHGACRAVNGNIEVGNDSKVEELVSINGRIDIGKNAEIKDDITSVNGSIQIGSGSIVFSDISSVNGDIELIKTLAKMDIETVNGDIELRDQSIVEGSIIIKGKDESGQEKRRVDIFLRGQSQVNGDISVEGQEVVVQVHLLDDSKILGDIINAEIIYQ